jgi:hypothetical protein
LYHNVIAWIAPIFVDQYTQSFWEVVSNSKSVDEIDFQKNLSGITFLGQGRIAPQKYLSRG